MIDSGNLEETVDLPTGTKSLIQTLQNGSLQQMICQISIKSM